MFSLCGAEGTDVDHTSQRGGHARFHYKTPIGLNNATFDPAPKQQQDDSGADQEITHAGK